MKNAPGTCSAFRLIVRGYGTIMFLSDRKSQCKTNTMLTVSAFGETLEKVFSYFRSNTWTIV